MGRSNAADSPEQWRAEKKKLHRKLILPNLCILLISLIAAISLVSGPFLQVTVPLNADTVETLVNLAGSDADPNAANDSAEVLIYIAKDIDTQIQISVAFDDIVAAGVTDGEAGLRQLLDHSLADLPDVADSVSEQIMPALLSIAAVQLAENVSLADIDTDSFNDTIALLGNQDPEGARTEFESAVEIFADEQLNIELSEDDRASIMDIYDKVIDTMTVDGEFSFSNLFPALQTLINEFGKNQSENTNDPSDSSATSVTDEPAPIEPAAPFASAVQTDAERAGETDSPASVNSEYERILKIMEHPSTLVDEMDGETLQIVLTVCKGMAYFLIACAGLWAILAIFALLHILLPNKKVGMWYVKLTGLLPFLLFFALPTLALQVAPSVIPSMPALPPLAFGGITYVSALCLLALWIVSVFWCHPIKKKISICSANMRNARR